MKFKNSRTTNYFLSVIFTAVIIAISAVPASGQGFMVKPMKIEAAVRPGRTVERVLELRNASPEGTEILDLKLVDLAQTSQGNLQAVEKPSGINTPSSFSCLRWTKLSTDSVTVEAMQAASVTITIKAPAGARGFYAAGILAQIRAAPTDKTVSIIIRFLIPIYVEIQGRPVRQKIQLNDVGMEFIEQSEKQPATTLLSMGIANQGRTYSRIKGTARVMRYWEGHWGNVTTAEFKELGILPGVKLNLRSDLARRLPSGRYKLTGTLYVDGRRIRPLEKEIEFVGDPSVTKLAVDTPLIIEPPMLSVTCAPGANRAAVIKVENASEDPVIIEAVAAIPPVLRGVALGDLKGEDLSCAEWVKVMPEKFTLRGAGRQNIGVIIKMPKAESIHPNYYGLLSLRATYPDGQSAGQTTTLICVQNKMVKAKPAAQVMKLTLAADEPSKYIVHAKFGNIGNVHFTPQCKAAITTAIGATVAQTALSGETGLMLPLETRDFSGVLDFSRVDEGIYILKAVLEYGDGGAVNKEIPIRVSIDEDQTRLVEIIEPKEVGPQPQEKMAKTGE